MMIEVEGNKLRQAFMVFKAASNCEWRNARKLFKKYVYIEHFNKHRYLLSTEEARRVEIMCSPNGHAYCKTMLIKASMEVAQPKIIYPK